MAQADTLDSVSGDELVSSYELAVNETEWCPQISHRQLLDLMAISSIDPNVGYVILNFKLCKFSLVPPYSFLPLGALKDEELYFDSVQNLFCGHGYLCVVQYNRVFLLNEVDLKKFIVSIQWNRFSTGKFFKIENLDEKGERILLLICTNDGYIYVVELTHSRLEGVQCIDFGRVRISQIAVGVGRYRECLVLAVDETDRVPILMRNQAVKKELGTASESQSKVVKNGNRLDLDESGKMHIKINGLQNLPNIQIDLNRILSENRVEVPQLETENVFEFIEQQKDVRSILMPVMPKQNAITVAWSPWIDFPYIALGTEEGSLLVYDFSLVHEILSKNPPNHVFTPEESSKTLIYKIKVLGEVRLIKFSPLPSVPFLAFYSWHQLYIVDLKNYKTQCFCLASTCCGIIWSLDAKKLFVSTLKGLLIFKIKKVALLTELILAKLITEKSIQSNSLKWNQLNTTLQFQLGILTKETRWI